MGAHYSSIQIRTEDRAAVKAATEAVAVESKRKFLLGPVLDGWIAVYPDDSGNDEQSAAGLARRINATVLHLAVHDSDIFFYNFFRAGKLVNEYCSDPDNFEEVSAAEHERLKARPEPFRELVDSPEKLAELTRLLNRDETKFTFEERRLEQFAKLLGIRNTLTSYEYFTQGERDGLKDWKGFIHIPDQTAEKQAKKAAEAALRAEKQRLQKEGVLCLDLLPPGNKRQRIHAQGEFCFDPVGGGLLLVWNRPVGESQTPQVLYYQKPWTQKPQALEVPLSWYGFNCHLTLSRTGRWLVFNDQKLQLWDWPQRKLVHSIQTGAQPVLFSQDEKLLLCHCQQKFELYSLETMQVVNSFLSQSTVEALALHPSHKFLVTRPAQEKLGIFNLETRKLEKTLFCGTRMDWSHIAPVFEGTLKQAGVGEQDLKEWKAGFIRGTEQVFRMRFSPDGHRLFCATTAGVRVFAWDDLLQASETTPRPLFGFTLYPQATGLGPDDRYYANFVYDVVHDEPQNRLLFCGIEGTIRFLNLADGNTGILVDPPGKSPIWKLILSPDRESICCFCTPKSEEANVESSRIQVWNYPALCKRIGLNF